MTTFRSRTWLENTGALVLPDPSRLSDRTPEMVRDMLGLTVHHTGYGGTLFHLDPLKRLRGIQAAHMAPGGLGAPHGGGDVAYELGFDADANVYGLRDSRWVGAHAAGTKRGGVIPNEYTNGVVYLEDGRGWTAGAASAFGWINDLFAYTHGGRHGHLFAHEWWSVTSCPQSYLIDVVRAQHGSV